MPKPNTLVDVSEGTSVSNSSPQSPTGSALLETPITLDFDPMSFQFKEDSPLTSPSDSNREIGEILSPSQNTEVVDFFDPFWPVKEESPTDYYPNVMLGQTSETIVLNDQQSQFSNGFTGYEISDNIALNESSQNQLSDPNDVESEDQIENFTDSVDTYDGLDRIDYADDRLIDTEDQIDIVDNIDAVELDDTPDRINDMPDEVINSNDKLDLVTFDDISDRDHDITDRFNDTIDEPDETIEKSGDMIDSSNNANDKSDEMLNDYYPNSDRSPPPSSKSEIMGDDLITELEQSQSEETCTSPVTEQVFDDNKHDISEHEQCQIFEDDAYKRSRTSSSASSQSSKSERTEKRTTYKTESSLKEDKTITNSVSIQKSKEIQKKDSQNKKGSTIIETNGYSSHNGVESTVNIKNIKNEKHDKENIKSPENQTSVTDLKSSFTKSSDESQQSILQEEVKPSVDRVKVQRTFSQTGQDELCLCKICAKHVYQMEKMKAEKNIFHKNCFRCKECNKLLTVDSYSSNEGDIYCKPHFRQLFQPKARFDGEDGAPRKQRRNEMIIRENTPAELPPDVVRSDSKPDHGLENIPVNLNSIKSKFETFREEHHLPSTTDVCALQRSASVMARLAKYQSAVSGGEAENGDLSESDNDDEVYDEDPTVIKPSKYKEKVVFSGMSNLKSQWETGSVAATKEEKMEEKKEELNKLRQRICLGRSESMKAVYEKACQDTSKVGSARTEPVDLGREVKATRIKEKFEKGDLVNEVEEENLEKMRKEKEEDLNVFTEPGIANDAKKLFKQIDATVKTTPVLSRSPNKSPINENRLTFHSAVKDGDVIKCSEPTEKEEILVDTTDVTQRFKFFENYSDSPKERKRFQITPPRDPTREETPEKDIPYDPNVIRSVDTVDDIPATDTARRMLDKFKQLEKETPNVPAGPKPLKRITPPREYTKLDENHDSSPEPERDPNIIRSSYKAEDDIIVEADKAKSLRAKFENWDNELRENKKNEEELEEDFLPQVDTTKTLRAKFEAIKEDTLKPVEKPKPKVNRFV